MLVVYPRGTVRVSSLGYFSSVGSSSKTSHLSLPLSIVERYIQEYFNSKRGINRKYINPKQEKARRKKRSNQMRVTVQAKLVVGFG